MTTEPPYIGYVRVGEASERPSNRQKVSEAYGMQDGTARGAGAKLDADCRRLDPRTYGRNGCLLSKPSLSGFTTLGEVKDF